ncbi:MAG: acylneuraminate cytidylyltransferase family protein [Elusimicrobia bacterium]|nr:acylneuraminate cytidylyltransferase family protein [Elusimicrobiota bacterium]
MTLLGLIPARGGSKGIPGKNLVTLGGRPLLDYTIAAALRARSLGAVAVTTDDAAIAARARKLGARVIHRPKALAGDQARMIAAVRHALAALRAEGLRPDAVVLLQPTSPFRTAAHVDEAAARWRRSGADSLVSVHPVSEHPCEALTRRRGRLVAARPYPKGGRGRQDFPPYWYVNGAIYITRTTMLERRGLFWDPRAELYEMPRVNGADIDAPEHLAVAEALLKASPALRRETAP